jgi:hypothetical protein
MSRHQLSRCAAPPIVVPEEALVRGRTVLCSGDAAVSLGVARGCGCNTGRFVVGRCWCRSSLDVHGGMRARRGTATRGACHANSQQTRVGQHCCCCSRWFRTDYACKFRMAWVLPTRSRVQARIQSQAQCSGAHGRNAAVGRAIGVSARCHYEYRNNAVARH